MKDASICKGEQKRNGAYVTEQAPLSLYRAIEAALRAPNVFCAQWDGVEHGGGTGRFVRLGALKGASAAGCVGAACALSAKKNRPGELNYPPGRLSIQRAICAAVSSYRSNSYTSSRFSTGRDHCGRLSATYCGRSRPCALYSPRSLLPAAAASVELPGTRPADAWRRRACSRTTRSSR